MRFAALPRADQKLIGEAVVALLVSMARLWIQDVEQLRAWAGRPRSGAVPVDRIVWAVEKAVWLIPYSTCLARGIAMQRLLSNNGHASQLAIGVGKANGRFTAHAWVCAGDRILIGHNVELASYKVIAVWSAGSQSVAFAANALA